MSLGLKVGLTINGLLAGYATDMHLPLGKMPAEARATKSCFS